MQQGYDQQQVLGHQQSYGRQNYAQMLPAGWVTGLDEANGHTYYYHEPTGRSQWEPPQIETRPHGAAPVAWRLSGTAGVTGFIDRHSHFEQDDYALPYKLRSGDEQVLSRFHMVEQKLTVSRKQAIVQVHGDGSAALTSLGRGPTLWRTLGGPWVALQAGDGLFVSNGDEVSLDCNDPDAAVFTCEDANAMQQVGYPQQQGGQPPLLPHPWEQLVDESGAAYFFNAETGEMSWDAIGKGYTGG